MRVSFPGVGSRDCAFPKLLSEKGEVTKGSPMDVKMPPTRGSACQLDAINEGAGFQVKLCPLLEANFEAFVRTLPR